LIKCAQAQNFIDYFSQKNQNTWEIRVPIQLRNTIRSTGCRTVSFLGFLSFLDMPYDIKSCLAAVECTIDYSFLTLLMNLILFTEHVFIFIEFFRIKCQHISPATYKAKMSETH
jgi:hypothetical protein